MNGFSRPSPILQTLGENISIARRRRHIPAQLLADRAGISRTTLGKIEKGDPGVSMGNYFAVLFSLGLHEQIAEIASPNVDHLGSLVGAHLPLRSRAKAGRTPADVEFRSFSSIDEWADAYALLLMQRSGLDITPALLKSLWREQGGKCAITGVSLNVNESGMLKPSIDRIDHRRPYEDGNIQIVLLSVNFMKNRFSQDEAKGVVGAIVLASAA